MKASNKISLVGTWLPLFGGFYNSRYWEANESDIRDEDDNELDYDKIYNYIDYEAYREAVSKQVTEVVGNKLMELGLISGIRYETISSPKYYNFTNDSINIEIGMTSFNINNLNRIIIENYDVISAEVKRRYSSRDGFISSHSNDLSEWIEETLEFTVNVTHKLAAILDIILQVVYEYNEGDVYDDFCDIDRVSLSDYFDYAGYFGANNQLRDEVIRWVDDEYMNLDMDVINEYINNFDNTDEMTSDEYDTYEDFNDRFGGVRIVIYKRIKEIEGHTLDLFI
jgi:hypothetical protein